MYIFHLVQLVLFFLGKISRSIICGQSIFAFQKHAANFLPEKLCLSTLLLAVAEFRFPTGQVSPSADFLAILTPPPLTPSILFQFEFLWLSVSLTIFKMSLATCNFLKEIAYMCPLYLFIVFSLKNITNIFPQFLDCLLILV